MKSNFKVLPILFLFISLSGVAPQGNLLFAGSFPPQAQTSTLDRLKQRIKQYEELLKDRTITDDVRRDIERYLSEARSEFETALNNEIASLRKLLKIVATEDDKRKEVEGKIQAFEQELQSLKKASSDSSAATGSPTNEKKQKPVESDKKQKPAESPKPTPPPQNPDKPSVVVRKPAALLTNSSASTPVRNIEVADCSQVDSSPQTYSLYEKYVCQVVNDVYRRKIGDDQGAVGNINPDPPDSKATLTPASYFAIALALIGLRDKPTYLVEAEESRTDKQVGAGPQANGSTSLVVKGSAPTILGLAVENGALTRSTNGNTITFRGNPIGILQALANKGYVQSFEASENNGFLRILKPFSFSLSYDTSRGNAQTNTGSGTMANLFTADKQQLSQVTARYEFVNHRDPRRKQYRKDWDDFLRDQADLLTDTEHRFFKAVSDDAALQKWFNDTQTIVGQTDDKSVEQIIKSRFAQLPVNDLAPTTIEALKSIEQSLAGYLTARKNLLDKIAKGTIVAFEYTNTRNVESPNLSNFRLIAEKGPGGSVDATFNGSLTIFDKLPMGMSSRIRDFQFAGQIDYKTRSLLTSGDLIFFAAGRYERLMEDAMMANGMIAMGTKGDIAVAQVGVKIPIKGTGFSIPISFSVANRTELIKEKEVRGNIGFTFDLDRLFSNIKP